jgi:hypothetical protein
MRFALRLNFDTPTERVGQAASRGLALAAEHILTESRRVVPIEEGTLERSGATSVDGNRAAISYDTPYAVRQHEELAYRHDAGRQAKYLEEPMLAERDTALGIVAEQIRSVT